jgi:5-methyltetrahydropteroyltriglutamate--homocysteine methyltransferase
MSRTHILGFPRIGAERELKFALETCWRGESDESALRDAASRLKRRHWQTQRQAGLATVAVGDFALYDHVLDLSVLLGALPQRFGFDARRLTLTEYFQLARGNAEQPAMEMTKWFDTNYHYLVPELGPDSSFEGGVEWFYDDVQEALAAGHRVKPVLVGPVTFLWLSKAAVPGFDPLTLLPVVVAGYERILRKLHASGIEWVQLDEPALCTELGARWVEAYETAYPVLARTGVKVLLATYFGSTAEYAPRIARLPVHGFHIDLVRAPEQGEVWRALLPRSAVLSAGVVDGRNVWRTDLRGALELLRPLHGAIGERLWIAPSCSLLHVPVALAQESAIDAEVRPWLAFATEKLGELDILSRALEPGDAAVAAALNASDTACAARRSSARTLNELVRSRVAGVTDAMAARCSPYEQRIAAQRGVLQLPPLPTTTIGSFPQTREIREARARYRRREIGALDYLQRIRGEIEQAVRRQEALGLDVLVHGEAERNDMVEYFAENLWGYAVTQNGWVQSYGSRCVKPPIIYGDVYRSEPITVDTARYAQSLTTKPMKGMLTGPVTLLQWSFVRDDQPRSATALQIALAIRDEVQDLEKAGIRVIQIDEPALREGLPLRRRDWPHYLAWAAKAFRISAAGVRDETQIHTHMCYSEFNDILPAIAALDADVITIETSRSNMALLDAFGAYAYPNDIGPGVYDIHSPRVPSSDDMAALLRRAAQVIPADRLWVNPDCGLKTRGWPETEAALREMVQAAKQLRTELGLPVAEPQEG